MDDSPATQIFSKCLGESCELLYGGPVLHQALYVGLLSCPAPAVPFDSLRFPVFGKHAGDLPMQHKGLRNDYSNWHRKMV